MMATNNSLLVTQLYSALGPGGTAGPLGRPIHSIVKWQGADAAYALAFKRCPWGARCALDRPAKPAATETAQPPRTAATHLAEKLSQKSRARKSTTSAPG